MAFDQPTRNRLQRFVGDARDLLTLEFQRQLQRDYGLDPESGEVADIATLSHLDDRRLDNARVLREILAHYQASAMTKGVKAQQDALQRIVREQAFTVLNRLAALRMMEARGLLFESISQGHQSKGFQLYQQIAGHALGEVGDTYRCYLFSLFDEFAQDLPLLFDRHAPNARLFPRDPALLELLALMNVPELEPLWAEDETIGWIYQYFNSAEERRQMRKESGAPRNSRELAVRNQFFTPRYVVEFLVDNTLGRQWFNWTGGNTALADDCQYLLCKPEERGRAMPAELRDPRSIKLLDPACGSMHFGLYAFDLFLQIYAEAWDFEQRNGPGSLTSDDELPPLSKSYSSEAAFHRDIPRLVIEHNIYGVEIDTRAAQIATLALWLRAQRAWHDTGVPAQDRPAVAKGHVIAAVAPPTEQELRESFSATLDGPDAELFVDTLSLLKGLPELGVLLRIERDLPHLVRRVFGEHGPMFEKEDIAHWNKAEARLRRALSEYVGAAQATYQGQLFAHDALEGLRLIDLVREQFDAVVMNPPFGALSLGVKAELTKAYARSKHDLLAIFVERGLDLLRPGGRLSAITSRTCFFLSSYRRWREEVILGIGRPEAMADLGHGVMDDAMVEAAAYVLEKRS